MKKEKLLVIIGPTSVGKTKLSIELAKRLNGEIISGDSMQIYRGMNIGTAKATPEEMDGVRHHLIDIKNPDESFSSAEFQELARPLITDIHSRGKFPIIAGGTGMYIQSVIYDYQFTEQAADPEYRKMLEEEASARGNEFIHKKLSDADPESAQRIHPNNVRRVIRALEIFRCTGKTMTEFLNEQEKVLLYDLVIVGLTMERSELYERIDHRVDLMMEQGLLAEAKQLHENGIRDCQSVQAIGYKELFAYLDGKSSLDDAVDQLKQNSRRYAKRQLTWFRNKMDVEWFDVSSPHDANDRFNEIFTYIAGKL